MEEDEVVISNWKRSDFEKELNEATERRANNKKLFEGEKASKENVDLNLWHDSGKTNRNFDDSEDEEVTFDDGTLSRLIEGDLKESEDVWTKSSSKPKPKLRQKGFPNTEKDSPADLFSGKNKTDKLHLQTSPRPVPRPRAKPILKENLSGSFSNKNNLGDLGNSTKLSADKLFDSVGKGNKTVSFQDLSENKDGLPKSKKKFSDVNHNNVSGNHNNVSGNQEDFWKKQTNEIGGKMPKSPPIKPARTKSRSVGVKKDSDEQDSDLHGNSHKPGPRRPTPRKPKDNVTQHNPSAVVHQMGNESKQYNGISHEQHISEREWQSNGFVNGKDYRENHRNIMGNNTEDFNVSVAENDQRFVERMMGHRDNNVLFESVRGSQNFLGQGQNIDAECSNKQNFERSEQGRFMNSRHSPRHHQDLDNSHRDFYKRDMTQMFEEHVPITENVLGQDEQKNYTKQRGRIEGKYKPNTPLKAEKRLEEMTKSPELYNNFHYESRDTPQSREFSSGKIGFSTKRSSSLTNLDDWRNAEFEEDQDVDEPGSWRSCFTSSTSIRQAVYNEWLEKKQKELKGKSKKKVDEKKKEEEKLKEEEERQLSAKKAFESWSSSKEEVIKDQVKKMKEIKDKEIDKKREKMAKQQDAKKFFKSWKSKKDEVLKESYKEKKTNEKDAKHKENEDKQEKIEIAKKSYDKWKVRKDEHIKEELKSKRRGDLLKTKYEKEAEIEKHRECENTFQKFLKKKGTWKRPPPTPTLTQRPWCPGGLTKGANLIPDKVNPVIPIPRLNRSRSFSGTSRTLR